MEAHLAHNQEYAGSSPVSATKRLKGKRKIKERSMYMANRLVIEQTPLKVGQVRKVTSSNGEKIDSITLQLNNNVEILFVPGDNGTLDFTVYNPKFETSNLDCSIDKDVLRDFFISIKDAYRQVIYNESEGTNS